MRIEVPRENNIVETIKAIGKILMDRAEDIGKDVKDVRNITIYSMISPEDIATIDVTKSYIVKLEE